MITEIFNKIKGGTFVTPYIIKPDEVMSQTRGCKISMTLLIISLLLVVHSPTVIASEKWGGIDESIVEKYAEEYGRKAREPFINTDQGDLLLFVFLLAGAVGGFVAGYSWRRLIEQKSKE